MSPWAGPTARATNRTTDSSRDIRSRAVPTAPAARRGDGNPSKPRLGTAASRLAGRNRFRARHPAEHPTREPPASTGGHQTCTSSPFRASAFGELTRVVADASNSRRVLTRHDVQQKGRHDSATCGAADLVATLRVCDAAVVGQGTATSSAGHVNRPSTRRRRTDSPMTRDTSVRMRTQPAQSIGKGIRIVGWDDEAGDAVLDHFGHAGHFVCR